MANQTIASSSLSLHDTTANPAPLGLLGFGMTTILLNLHNAGFFGFDAMILGMGIFYGGLGQILVGIMEWKKNNTFGATAFTSYGLFWLSLVALVILPKTGFGAAPQASAMVAYLSMWGLFSAVLFIGTFRLNKALVFVFGTLADPLLPARRRRGHRQPHHYHHRRVRRDRLRPLGHVHRPRPGAERGLRSHRRPLGDGQKVILLPRKGRRHRRPFPPLPRPRGPRLTCREPVLPPTQLST